MKKNKRYKVKPIPVVFLIMSLFIITYAFILFINSFSNSDSVLATENLNINFEEPTLKTINSKVATSTDLTNYSVDSTLSSSSLSYIERLNILHNNDYPLADRIKIYLGHDINNIGLIYYNIENGDSIFNNASDTFIAASTYKVGLNLYVYYLYSIGQINLNDYIQYEYCDYEEGTGILQYEDYISAYSIQDLLDLSLIYSDNIATNMLGRYLGGHEEVRKNLYELLNIDFDYTENIITPAIEFKILEYIYDNKDLDTFSHMINVLTETEYNDRLSKYLNEDIVAHKIGTYDTYVHDVGIVLDDSPYILIIYTYDIDDSEEKIANISKAVYEYNNLNY